MKKCDGLTLIEMLCAMTLSMIIMILVLTILLNYKTSFKTTQAISEVQENARFAIRVLTSEISQAGYVGCAKLSENLPIIDLGVDADSHLFYFNALGVYDDSNWRSNLSSQFTLNPKPGSNIILVRSVSSKTNELLEDADETNLVRVSLKPEFNVWENIAISDCKKLYLSKVQDVFRSEKNNYQQLTLSGKLEKKVRVGSEVGEITTSVFDIQETSRKNSDGENIYALYQFDSNGKRTELVTEVIEMKVLCVEKRSTGEDVIVNPSEVLNWADVKILKVLLLVCSDEDVLPQPKPYEFNHKKYFPSDKKLYRAVIFYIPIGG